MEIKDTKIKLEEYKGEISKPDEEVNVSKWKLEKQENILKIMG